MEAHFSQNVGERQAEGKEIDNCSICLVELKRSSKIRKLKCNHTFHKKCIDKWTKKKKECPLCKSKFVEGSDNEIAPKGRTNNNPSAEDRIEVVDGYLIGSYMPIW